MRIIENLPHHLKYLSSIYNAVNNKIFEDWVDNIRNTAFLTLQETLSTTSAQNRINVAVIASELSKTFINALCVFVCEQEKGRLYWTDDEYNIYIKPLENLLAVSVFRSILENFQKSEKFFNQPTFSIPRTDDLEVNNIVNLDEYR